MVSKDQIQQEMIEAWRRYISQVESSLSQLEQEIKQVMANKGDLTDEWLQYGEHGIEEISSSVFSMSEPKWANIDDAELIKNLKKRIYEFCCRLHELRTRIDEE